MDVRQPITSQFSYAKKNVCYNRIYIDFWCNCVTVFFRTIQSHSFDQTTNLTALKKLHHNNVFYVFCVTFLTTVNCFVCRIDNSMNVFKNWLHGYTNFLSISIVRLTFFSLFPLCIKKAIMAVEEGRLVNFITQKLYMFKSVKVGETDFDELVKATKSILKGKRLPYGVLVKQLLKRKIVKGDALVSAFLLRAVSEGYLKKARKGKLVYYSSVDEREKKK